MSEKNTAEQKPFEKKVLRETVREYLINSILNKKFVPGERIIETQIAKEINVSQGTVREALRELEAMGFIETEVYKGARVRSFTEEELVETWEVRALLEGHAVHTGFISLNKEIAALEHIVQKMVECAEHASFQKQIELDIEFHRLILIASANRALYKVWNSLGLPFWTYFGIYSTVPQTDTDFKQQAERHGLICKAIRSGDQESAEKSIINHFNKSKRMLEDISRAEEIQHNIRM